MYQSFQKAIELISSNDVMLGEIVNTTLKMAFTSSILALLIGAPFGLLVASFNFPGKRAVVMFLRTLMGFPPVVVGILVYMLFSGTGPFGKLRLIYSVELMIIAQVILISPIVSGMTESSLSPIVDKLRPTTCGLRLNPFKSFCMMVYEGKYQFIAIYLFAFARAISEVGAVQIVGGNILNKTRVMTTAIALNYNTGDFSVAVALGIILMLISLGVNFIAALLQWRSYRK
ncbi:MAG: ABC transporter permease [Clostridia bacterium]